MSGSSSSEERPYSPEASADSALQDEARETLAFEVTEGHTHNAFYRRGPIAAHLLTTSGRRPRILVSFPAGNAGAGLWFDETQSPVFVRLEGALEPVERADGMRGVRARVTIDAGRAVLRVQGAVVGTLRAIRRYAYTGALLEEMIPTILRGPPLAVERTMLDGTRIALVIEPDDGTTAEALPDGTIAIESPRPSLRLTALTDARPLTPIPTHALVTEAAADSPRDLRALAFLAYEEKLLAGSWRFLTYFGRDTLLSLRMLMPVLRPAVIEAALGSVLDRLGPEGDVAHEEEIGEWAVWLRRRGLAGSAAQVASVEERAPIFDYAMVDDDFLLAPVLAHYLFDSAAGRAGAAEFLARRTPSGRTYGEAVRANLDRVLRLATPFGARAAPDTLIALKPGKSVGEWRDSLEGLGRGTVPYDVNAALVPAALRAAERLFATARFGHGAARSEEASRLARAWSDAASFFEVSVPPEEASDRVASYARELGIDPSEAIAAIDGSAVRFPGVALDLRGEPIPIQHSDDGFALLFGDPAPGELVGMVERILHPFPAGLRTPVGIVVANPAYASDAALRALFTTGHYHGTVVWSWHQALLASGLRRQLARADLPAATRARLGAAERALWGVIRATKATSTTELWSFGVSHGRYEIVPFGQGARDADESNAAQLWSTVYLAVREPGSAEIERSES